MDRATNVQPGVSAHDPPGASPHELSPGDLADALPEIVCICNELGVPFKLNRAWFAFTGLPRQQAPAESWHAALHPADAARYAEEFARHTSAAQPFTIEFRLRRSDGAERTMLARVAAAGPASEGRSDWVASCVDIDARKTERGRHDDPRGESRITDSRLRKLLESNIVGIVVSNNAGAILDANDAFLRIIGYSRDDLAAGRIDWRQLTPAQWLPLDDRAIAEMAEHGMFAPYEKEYIRPDGSRVPVSLGGVRLDRSDDEQICYIVDLSDIRRTEAALRRSESRFERLSSANVIGILSSRVSDRTIVEVNDEFLRTIGYDRADFDARRIRWTDLTPPQWLGATDRAMRELERTGRFAPFETEYIRRDGSHVWVLVGGALLADSPDEMICCVLDLSEQKTATLQIERSERRYRALAEALPQMIMMTNAARHPVYVNRYYETYTGVCLDDISARWRETIHPDDLPEVDRLRATGLPYEIEYRIRRASDGAYRWHFARCLELPGDSSGERWLSTSMDIDDRRRAEESLRFIEKAGSLLSQSLDLQMTFATLMDLVIPAFGEWAYITLLDDDGRIRTAVAAHSDPAKAEQARALAGTDFLNEDAAQGTPCAYRSGTPQVVHRYNEDDLPAGIKAPYIDVIRRLGYGSAIALPIRAGDATIGALTIVSSGNKRRYGPADLPPLEELARRAGFAIANARQYEREHRVASLLQEAALPRMLPATAGLTFDGYYQAGRQEARIGGDWYDVIAVADGRIVVSVGDVAGSGLQAAVLMSSVRQIIRGAAHVHADPLVTLDIADRTVRGEHENGVVTAFVGVIDPVLRTLHYASAGHLPALLRTAAGDLVELDAPGLPLGCRNLAPSESRRVDLPRDSCLLLYTDGLVEWSRDLLEGHAVLRERFAAAGAERSAHPARDLVERVLPPSGARDDVAALTVTLDA